MTPPTTQQTTLEKDTPKTATVPVTCPHCGKGFFHKIGHTLKELGEATADIALSNLGAFHDD